MNRVLIGPGNSLGSYLFSTGSFTARYSYSEAINDLKPANEIVVISPAASEGEGSTQKDKALIAALKGKATRIIGLSSLAVYPSRSLPFDEDSFANLAGDRTIYPWVRHRNFERGLAAVAANVTVLRLPDVFGPGFFKGAASVLLDRNAHQTNRVAIHQWYPAHRLMRDIIVSRHLKVPAINLCPEPLSMHAVLEALFPGEVGYVATPAPYSRIRTRYGEAFGGSGGYIMSAAAVTLELSNHVNLMRRLRPLPVKKPPTASAGKEAALW